MAGPAQCLNGGHCLETAGVVDLLLFFKFIIVS